MQKPLCLMIIDENETICKATINYEQYLFLHDRAFENTQSVNNSSIQALLDKCKKNQIILNKHSLILNCAFYTMPKNKPILIIHNYNSVNYLERATQYHIENIPKIWKNKHELETWDYAFCYNIIELNVSDL